MTITFASLLFFTLVLKKSLLLSSAMALLAAVILYTNFPILKQGRELA